MDDERLSVEVYTQLLSGPSILTALAQTTNNVYSSRVPFRHASSAL